MSKFVRMFLVTCALCFFLSPVDVVSAGEFEDMGMIDVTNPPAGLTPARGDGITDDTAALQAIINYAYYGTDSQVIENNLVDPSSEHGRFAVILPGRDDATGFKGEYKVSDTLVLFQNAVRNKRKGERAHILIGSTRTGNRPVIRLASNAPKFRTEQLSSASLGFSQAVKPVIMISANAATLDRGGCDLLNTPDINECDYLKTGDNFEQKIKNIEIIVGPGNPNAVGLNFAGAQHSAIEDVKITMESGFAGIDALPGVSSVMTNIEVVGGKYGIYGDFSRTNAYASGVHMVGAVSNVKLINQTEYALYNPQSLGAISLVGFEIRKQEAPAIKLSTTGTGNMNFRSEVALVDGIIEFERDSALPAIENPNGKGTSITNLYIKNASKLTQFAGNNPITLTPQGFTRISEYISQNKGFTNGMYIDGAEIQELEAIGQRVENQDPASDPLLTSHTWLFPNYSFDHLYQLSKNPSEHAVCNALSNSDPYEIRADGSFDDAPGLQAVVDDPQCQTIILPKGKYTVKSTLNLQPHTRLIGLNTSLTSITTDRDWNPTKITPVIRTANAADAPTTIEDILIQVTTRPTDWFIGLDWMAGKGMVKNVYTNLLYSKEGGHQNPKPQDRISGNGGGKWFAYDAIGGSNEGTNVAAESRKLLVVDTTQPLTFYNLSSEDGRAFQADAENGFQSEFRNAKNISVYGSKNENCNPYGIVNSDNIFFFGVGKMSISFTVVDSNNIEFKTVTPNDTECDKSGSYADKILVQRDGGSTRLLKQANSPLALYRKGSPDRYKTIVGSTRQSLSQQTDIAPEGNLDGKVTVLDYDLLIAQFGRAGSVGFHAADIVPDGVVDIFDYNALLQDFDQ